MSIHEGWPTGGNHKVTLLEYLLFQENVLRIGKNWQIFGMTNYDKQLQWRSGYAMTDRQGHHALVSSKTTESIKVFTLHLERTWKVSSILSCFLLECLFILLLFLLQCSFRCNVVTHVLFHLRWYIYVCAKNFLYF
jgi:hypothetical protein